MTFAALNVVVLVSRVYTQFNVVIGIKKGDSVIY